MHDLGQRMVAALEAQRFRVTTIPDTVLVTSPDRKRTHVYPLARFTDLTPVQLAGLRIIATGLEVVEGLVLSPEWWDDATA